MEELQDPMLSAGLLKTREQVVRVLANVDKNNTMGIDFEEFLLALSANKLADPRKLKRLQQMSADPNFDTDTLITADRRKKLIRSILRRCEERQKAMEKLYKKYDRPNLTKKEREQFNIEREKLEETQSKSVYLHLKYVHALEGVIDERKSFYEVTRADKEEEEERERQRRDVDSFYKTIAEVRLSSNSRAETIDRLARTGAMSLGTKSDSLLPPLHPSRQVSDLHASQALRSSSNVPVLGSEVRNFITARKDSTVDELRNNPYKIYAPVRSKQGRIPK